MFPTSWGAGRSARLPLASCLLVGCGGAELPGDYFDVRLEGTDNQCTDDAPGGYTEALEYRVEAEGTEAQLAVGEDVFATGTIEGCTLTYTSLVWTSYRDNQEVQWQILGSARIDRGGGDGCVTGDSDWEGTEQFIVLSSEYVSAGCTYDLAVTGKWSRAVE